MSERDLSIFFPEQVVKREAGFILTPTKRIKGEEGKPVSWEFIYPDYKTFKEIKEAGQKQSVEGGKILFKSDPDNLFLKAITECAVFPDLKNAKLQDAYKAVSPEELLQKMLYPDEVEKLGRDIAVKIGLIDDPMSLLEEAKN